MRLDECSHGSGALGKERAVVEQLRGLEEWREVEFNRLAADRREGFDREIEIAACCVVAEKEPLIGARDAERKGRTERARRLPARSREGVRIVDLRRNRENAFGACDIRCE